MSNSINKPTRINTNQSVLKVDPLSSGPPRYRPPPQPLPPKSQNYLLIHDENSSTNVNTDQYNHHFQDIDEVNRLTFCQYYNNLLY